MVAVLCDIIMALTLALFTNEVNKLLEIRKCNRIGCIWSIGQSVIARFVTGR